MRSAHKFTLSLNSNDDQPGILLAAFALPPHEAHAFAEALGLPWPGGDISEPNMHVRKGRLQVSIERILHAHRSSAHPRQKEHP